VDPNSPDINPVDYATWVALYRSKCATATSSTPLISWSRQSCWSGAHCHSASLIAASVNDDVVCSVSWIRTWQTIWTCVFTRRRSWSFAEYWKHFVARLNDVHAFGYNSTGSEIWMKFGALRVYCLELAWRILGAIWAEARAGARADFFVFCQVNNARLYRFPVGQILRNLHTRRGSARWWIVSERNFQHLPARGRFFPKPTSSRTTSDFIRR